LAGQREGTIGLEVRVLGSAHIRVDLNPGHSLERGR
jgi:hypothetical protein